MSEPRWKVEYVPWWRPRRLAVKQGESNNFVGWVWRQKAYLTNNIHHGWVAFVEHQTEEKLTCCPQCKRPLEDHKE